MPKVDNWNTAQILTWDAWNRPVTVSQNGATLGTYQYDGLNRRIWKQSVESGSTVQRQFYYSSQWQVLEERTGTSTTADRQYVWGVRYQDDLVLRDVISGTASRMYALADYFQPTAICDVSGVVQERYVYRAFGDVSYYNGSFAPISTSAYGWEYLFGSYYFDLESLLYQVRYRYYHTSLGRWISRDPLRNAELSQCTNLYWYGANNAVNVVDPSGLDMCTPGDFKQLDIEPSSGDPDSDKDSAASSGLKKLIGALDLDPETAVPANLAAKNMASINNAIQQLFAGGAQFTVFLTLTYECCECKSGSPQWAKQPPDKEQVAGSGDPAQDAMGSSNVYNANTAGLFLPNDVTRTQKKMVQKAKAKCQTYAQ